MLPHARFLTRSRRSWLSGAVRALAAVPAAWSGGRVLPAGAQTAPPFTTTFGPTPTPPPFTPTFTVAPTPPPFTTTFAPTATPPPFTTLFTFAPTPPPTFLPTLPPGTLPPLTPPPTFFTPPPGGGGANPVPAPAAAAVFGSGLAAMVAWLWGRGIRDRIRALIERLAGPDGR